MTAKTDIVAHLGGEAILLPTLIQDGLRANDRAKVRMSALQSIMRHAAAPTGPVDDLSRESESAGLDPVELERLIRSSQRLSGDLVGAPGVGSLIEGVFADVETMMCALRVACDPSASLFEERLGARRTATAMAPDAVAASTVAAITTAAETGSDSVHRLVMDLHKALNRLSSDYADEEVDGARAFGLSPDDRPHLKAFMRGLEKTRKLKFDHPGLDTTAARSGGRLIIQNDIGVTDAHVILVSVCAAEITVTYSDIHRARAKFFVGLFDKFEAEWTDLSSDAAAGVGEGSRFYLVTGRFSESDKERREEFLEAVGAALVFLIDWNKARKTLRLFIDKSGAGDLLRWAAHHGFGHRAFLQLGGGDLVDGAIRRVAATRIDYGVRLDQALGRRSAVEFLRAVLKLCSESLLLGRAERLAMDGVDAELARRLRSSEMDLLQGVVRQAGLAREIAVGLVENIKALKAGRLEALDASAGKAKRIEEKADRLAVALRSDAKRFRAAEGTSVVIDAMEDAIDDLEEAAFLSSLLPPGAPAGIFASLEELARIALEGAETMARAADAVAMVPEGEQVDADDALEAISTLGDVEHAADESERSTLASLIRSAASTTGSMAALECARRVERATDHFARAAHRLRAHAIGDLTN